MESKKSARQSLTDSAKEAAKGIKVSYFEEEERYTKKQFVQIYKGYDFLENFLIVRQYIQKRYDVSLRELEFMLKLMAMRLFTYEDYHNIPRAFSFNYFRTAIDKGFVVLVADHNKTQKRLYTLSTRGKNICIKFYKYLSGEEKIPETGQYNPMAVKGDQQEFDRKRMMLIKKLNKLPMKSHFRKLKGD